MGRFIKILHLLLACLMMAITIPMLLNDWKIGVICFICSLANAWFYLSSYVMDETRVIIAGSRDFDDYELLNSVVKEKLRDYKNIKIISGGCSGADTLGERFAKENNLDLKVFQAEWKKYGRAAGPIRNKAMAQYASQVDNCLLIAFPVGSSRGTRNMISLAKEHGLDVHVVEG